MTPKQEAALRLAKELDGVIADVEEGAGFDDVCLDTVKYVRDALAEQLAQIPDAFDRLMREADKPTQVPEQLAKYVAAIAQGTHEITSVTIRPKRASKPWVDLTDDEIDDIYQGAGKNDLKRAREVLAAFKEKNT